MILVIPIFVPHAGCPHNCTFCNQKAISGENSLPTAEDILKTIELYRNAAARYDEVQLAFYGGSFTAIPETVQVRFLETVQPFLKVNGGFIDVLRCSTRPDCIDEKVVERLRKYHLSIVELGTQSMDDGVLAACERGHSAADTAYASRLLKESGFVLGLQMMTGLPGSDDAKDLATAEEIIALKPDFVRIYPTIVVKNTKMAKDYFAGKYVPQSLQQAVELCATLCEKYEEAGIKVVRLGLQSTDNITSGEGSDIVAGPYHEAFGDKVKSFRYQKKIDEVIESICLNNPYKLTIVVDKKQTSSVVGSERCNVLHWKEKFGFKNVKVLPSNELFLRTSAEISKEIAWRSREAPDGLMGDSVLIRVSSL